MCRRRQSASLFVGQVVGQDCHSDRFALRTAARAIGAGGVWFSYERFVHADYPFRKGYTTSADSSCRRLKCCRLVFRHSLNGLSLIREGTTNETHARYLCRVSSLHCHGRGTGRAQDLPPGWFRFRSDLRRQNAHGLARQHQVSGTARPRRGSQETVRSPAPRTSRAMAGSSSPTNCTATSRSRWRWATTTAPTAACSCAAPRTASATRR